MVGDTQHTDVIRHIAAVQAGNNDVIVQIAKADIITTAVGPQVLAKIAATIARGLQLRFEQVTMRQLILLLVKTWSAVLAS